MTSGPPKPALGSRDYNDWRMNRRISEEEIFAELIKTEVREGPLTAARRRRLVRYAAHLHLSAVDVGQMITQCRAGLDSDTPHPTPPPTLQPVPPPEPQSAYKNITALVVAALTIDILILWLVF